MKIENGKCKFFDNFQYHYRSLPVEIGLDPSHPKKVQRISLRATELSYYSKLSDIERDNLVMVLKPHDNIYSKLLKTSINCQQFAAFSKNALDNNFCDYRVNAEMLRTILKLCKK